MQVGEPSLTIAEIYQGNGQPIPYPIFMRCFDALLEDPETFLPKTPAPELEDQFRAVCMALDLGIRDNLDRGRDRECEFNEHILPVWKEWLSQEKFKTYRRILNGTIRKERRLELWDELHFQAMREEQQREQAAEEARKRHAAELKEVTAEAISRRGGEVPEEVDEGPEPPAEPPPEEPPEPEKTSEPFVFPHANALIDALSAQEVPIRYSTLDEREPMAVYNYAGRDVTVVLIRAKKGFALLLTCPSGSQPNTAGLEEAAKNMGYQSAAANAFAKKRDEMSWKVQLGDETFNLAVQQEDPFDVVSLPKTLQNSHREFARMLAGLDSD